MQNFYFSSLQRGKLSVNSKTLSGIKIQVSCLCSKPQVSNNFYSYSSFCAKKRLVEEERAALTRHVDHICYLVAIEMEI